VQALRLRAGHLAPVPFGATELIVGRPARPATPTTSRTEPKGYDTTICTTADWEVEPPGPVAVSVYTRLIPGRQGNDAAVDPLTAKDFVASGDAIVTVVAFSVAHTIVTLTAAPGGAHPMRGGATTNCVITGADAGADVDVVVVVGAAVAGADVVPGADGGFVVGAGVVVAGTVDVVVATPTSESSSPPESTSATPAPIVPPRTSVAIAIQTRDRRERPGGGGSPATGAPGPSGISGAVGSMPDTRPPEICGRLVMVAVGLRPT
jgi:hypothetical protein